MLKLETRCFMTMLKSVIFLFELTTGLVEDFCPVVSLCPKLYHYYTALKSSSLSMAHYQSLKQSEILRLPAICP